jgi:hypothetical protein
MKQLFCKLIIVLVEDGPKFFAKKLALLYQTVRAR